MRAKKPQACEQYKGEDVHKYIWHPKGKNAMIVQALYDRNRSKNKSKIDLNIKI